jgi:hypothetical protein
VAIEVKTAIDGQNLGHQEILLDRRPTFAVQVAETYFLGEILEMRLG